MPPGSHHHDDSSLIEEISSDLHGHATAILEGTSKRRRLGQLLPFLGPAFIACIAYMDPGNFATNIQGGA